MKYAALSLFLSLTGLVATTTTCFAQQLKPGVLWTSPGMEPHSFIVNSVSPRGPSFTILSSDGYNTIQTDLTGNRSLHASWPVASSGDGRYLVTRGGDYSLYLFDIPRKLRHLVPFPGTSAEVSVETVEGKVTVAAGGYGKVRVWSPAGTSKLIQTYEDSTVKLLLDRDDRYHVRSLTADGTIFVDSWRQNLVGNIGRIDQPLEVQLSGPGRASPDGIHVAIHGHPWKLWLGSWRRDDHWVHTRRYYFEARKSFQLDYPENLLPPRPSYYEQKFAMFPSTETGFTFVRVRQAPPVGGYREHEWDGALVVMSPGEGSYAFNDYLALKGIPDRIDPKRAIQHPIKVIEKGGYRFMLVDWKLFNLGAIPGYKFPPVSKIPPNPAPGTMIQ
jgi:hypothetical protein